MTDTNVRDDDLRHVAALPNLRGLRLDRTQITDDGLAQLESSKTLRTRCLRDSRASPEAVERLKTRSPNCCSAIHSAD